jgi:serine/threonine protein kinase
MLAELSDKAFNTSYNASYASTSASSLGSMDSLPCDPQSEFEDLTTVKTIYEGKFAVYLVLAPTTKRYYALKVFPWEDNEPTSYFLREARFGKLIHPNLISIPHYVIHHTAYYDETPTNISYMLMEYAKYGDMFNALVKYKIPFNETLVRTYFHQLIEGLEFLHSNGAAHLDIKLENLLIGDSYTLKIADFDLSYFTEDGPVKTRGTKNFRAPELYSRNCKNPFAADVYSAGIMLFLLTTRGNLPYLEDKPEKGLDMAEVKESNPKLFWEKHCQLLGKTSGFFSNDFKDLFLGMTDFDATRRMTMMEVKSSKWYNGETYCKKEVVEYMKNHFGF